MRIGPMSSHHSPADLDSLYRSNESSAAGPTVISTEEQEKLLRQIDHNRTLTQILGEYDVTDITTADFSAMTERLELESLISPESRELLAGVRGDLARFDIGADESVDLLDFYTRLTERLADPESSDPPLPPEVTFDEKAVQAREGWMLKFATLQDTPRAMGINARA